VQHAEIGVASILMALSPVIILPFSYFIFKERIGWQAIVGNLLAIAGSRSCSLPDSRVPREQ
jgi:drug/metabolite transporter (DMT)-like permease